MKTYPDGCAGFAGLLTLALVLAWAFAFAVKSGAIFKNPVWTRKSHTRLVLFTSILTKSRASRRRSLPPLLAYSRTSVSLITRYGLGKIRREEHKACSSGRSKWSMGLFARFKGATVM